MRFNGLYVRWSKRERDLKVAYPRKCDGAYVFCAILTQEVQKELERRGYDLTTLTFRVGLKEPEGA